LRVATYNLHGCVGRDGVFAPERVCRIVSEFEADVVALQEVSSGPAGAAGLAVHRILTEAFEGYEVWAPTFDEEGHMFGNLLLSRWPILERTVADISVKDREPRNAISARLDAPFGPLRVIATHLGLKGWERVRQAEALCRVIDETVGPGPVVLAGDLNLWNPFSRVGRALGRATAPRRRIPTFPTGFPMFPLDAIMVRSVAGGITIRRYDTPETRIASDHFPLIADVSLG